jgi:FMN-dependent NADH-azoreductase
VGLTLGKKMVVITSRGGDYSANSPFHVFDFQEPYLRAIFGFVGITDIQFINAQPMDITPAWREVAMTAALQAVNDCVANTDWTDKLIGDAVENPAGLKPQPQPQPQPQ